MTLSLKDQRLKIREILCNNDLNELKNYIKKNKIELKNINNSNYDILIYAIEENVSLNILKYIINQTQYENLNYVKHFYYKNNHPPDVKVPLYIAVSKCNFEIADFLLKNKANINSNYDDGIINHLINHHYLNISNLKYILRNGFDITKIDLELVSKFIKNNSIKQLEYLFKYFIFDNNFVIKLLNMLRNKISLTDDELYSILNNEKNKLFIIDDNFYKIAINDNKVLNLIFDYDSSDPDVLFCRIHKLNLLKIAINQKNFYLIRKIIKYGMFNDFNKIINLITSNNDFLNSNDISKNSYKERNCFLKFIIKSVLESMTKKKAIKNEEKGKIIISNKSTQFIDISFLNLLINIAIKSKDLDLIKYIMENNFYQSLININVKDINGEYPIITSVITGDLNIFKYLVEHGADYNIKDSNEKSVISLAMETNSYILKYLLKKSDINEIDDCFNSLFFNAIGRGDKVKIENIIFLVKYRINKNLDMNIKNFNGDTPLIFSYKLGHKNIFKFLIKYCNINEKDIHGYPLLYYIINNRDSKMLKILIKMGIDINTKDPFGNSALQIAIDKHDKKIINILLENPNLKINTVNNQGNSPFMSFIKSNYFNPYFDSKSCYSRNQFFDSHDVSLIFNKFIERRTNLNFIDCFGNSPIFYMVQKNLSFFIKEMIQNGANTNIKNKDGYSPLEYALKEGKYRIANDLFQFGCNIYNEDCITIDILTKLILSDYLDLFKYIFTKFNYDINKYNEERNQALLDFAYENEKEDIVRYLKEYDSIFHSKNEKVGKKHNIDIDDDNFCNEKKKKKN